MMEPAVLQQQQQQQPQLNDYDQKVNEMQELLPSLEQRITNATLQKENTEELQKLKLLQQVLCGQKKAVGGSLTVEELDNYAAMLKNAGNTLLLSTSMLDANVTVTRGDEAHTVPTSKIFTEANNEKQEIVDANLKEIREKKPESVAELQLLQEKCEKVNEAPNKENGSSESKNESAEQENESTKREVECLEDDTSRGTKDIREVLLPSVDMPAVQDLLDDASKEKKTEFEQQNNAKSPHIVKEALSNFEVPEDIEEMEYEDVELIKIPESTADDEMILPDCADEAEFSSHKSDEEEEERGIDEEEEQFIGHTEEEEITVSAEGNPNEVDKAAAKYNEDVEKSGSECSEESTNAKEPEQVTQDNDISQRSSESTKESNENENEETCDDEAHSEDAVLEEISQHQTGSNEPNCTLPVEIAVEMDSQNSAAIEVEEMPSDDPLGQMEIVNEPLGEAERSHQSSAENEVTSEYQSNKKQSVPDAAATKSTSNDDNDDDDVEIIESRNSPICLDTDDEDEQTTKANEVADKELQTTVVSQPQSHIPQPSPQSEITIKATKSVTETIELLDSSDEDNESSSNMSQLRRRNKRQITAPTVIRTLVKMPAQHKHFGKKRTLLPAVHASKPLKISQVLSGGAIPAACRAFLSDTPTTPSTPAAKTPRSALFCPPKNFKPTPQSNFLNAVNLLPATATTGDNPLAFSATLSNKNIIIPNAFYANRRTTAKENEKDKDRDKERKERATTVPETASSSSSSLLATSSKMAKLPYMSVTQQQERVYREWLDGFIQNFANPQQIASHSCLVLMQSALKYKVFAHIKDLRTTLNTKAYTSDGTTDVQLLRELYNTFYTNDCRLSIDGLRFCAGACTHIGSNVTLMTDARTGRITTRTSAYDELFARFGTPNGGGATSDDKRKRQKGDEEYTPAKYYEKKVEKSGAGQGERRKSLRQHRTRCYDETFLYEPEEADDDEPPTTEQTATADKRRPDAQMMALVQRKAEEKRLEAKRQRQQQVKSFESAYLEMFASSLRDTNVKGTNALKTNNEGSTQSRGSSSTDSASNQIVIDDDDDDSLLDDEPRSHRIYKVVPTRLLAATNRTESPESIADETPKPKRGRPRKQDVANSSQSSHSKANEPELITCDSTSGDSASADDNDIIGADSTVPKNININWHASSGDWCKICKKRIPRTVSHYVNEHPNCEVYTSRIPKPILARLRKQGGQVLEMRPYLNGQEQYAADCVFCQKSCCFKIPYWYQHFSMHTGEYAFRCSGCNIRKTTRSAMMNHIHLPCRKRGSLLEDYTYNARPKTIEMRICRICNYMQLNRRNILKHLRTQHGFAQVQAKHVESIVLLRMPEPEVNKMPEVVNEFMDLSSGGDENSDQMAMTFNYDDFDTTGQAGMWDEGDPTDDLSYMICGMLDVEMRGDDD